MGLWAQRWWPGVLDLTKRRTRSGWSRVIAIWYGRAEDGWSQLSSSRLPGLRPATASSAVSSLLGFLSCCNKPDFPDFSLWDWSLTLLQRFFGNNSGLCCCTMYTSTVKQCSLIAWQSSRPASFSPAGLTLWSIWLERWLATLSRLSTQVRIPVGLSVPGLYIGGSSAGLGKAQRIDSSLRADWLSCFFLAWWEWRVATQGCLVQLWKGECYNPAGLLASRQRVWLFGRIGESAGSRFPDSNTSRVVGAGT